MKQETIILNQKETTAKVQNTMIQAVREKNITKKAVRVFDNNCIGISGAVGDVEDAILIEQAKTNLTTNIAYPYPLTSGVKEHRNLNQHPMESKEVVELSEKIVAFLREEFSDFDFSQGISQKQISYQMKNTEGLDVCYEDAHFEVGLILKDKQSANLFDGAIGYSGRHFDFEKFKAFNRTYLEAYRHVVPLPEGDKLPVFQSEIGPIAGFLLRHLNGETYAMNSSLFSGKLKETLFNEKVTLEQNRDSEIMMRPFFDSEGTVMKNDRVPLIEKGKLVNVYTDKKTASKYDLPLTGSAAGAYDDKPSVHLGTPIRFKIDSTDIKKALNGKMAILAVISSGGDLTPDGSFAAPVQVSFLFDGEKIIGKLPEFTMRSTLFDMYGKDYIGTFKSEHAYVGEHEQLQGYYMTIVKPKNK